MRVTRSLPRLSLLAVALATAVSAAALGGCNEHDPLPGAFSPSSDRPATAQPMPAATPQAEPSGAVATVAPPAAQPGAQTPFAPMPPQSVVAAVPQYAPPAYAPVTVAPQPPQIASNHIGSIDSIEPIRERPQGSGTGAVIGGVLGAVVGNQFGHGGGRAAMTGLGAVGGAVAGNNVERNHNERVTGYRIHVHLDNGSERTFERGQIGNLHVGNRVRVDNGGLRRV